MEKKKYEITKTKNGFIIELCHEDRGYRDENKLVALSLNAIIRILKEDNKKDEKI